jgi:antitoxin (DNA-binding transcriptional repressor) of toxin-antitoxin stability system
MESVSVTELVRSFSEYLNRVVYRGERFVVLRGGKRVAEIGPMARGTTIGTLQEVLDQLPTLGPDAEAFARDVAAHRNLLPIETDPWES